MTVLVLRTPFGAGLRLPQALLFREPQHTQLVARHLLSPVRHLRAPALQSARSLEHPRLLCPERVLLYRI